MAKNKKQPSSISNALAALEKRFGEPVVSKMTDVSNISTFSTTRPKMDIALSGGWAKGKIIEIYGEEATGKTGLALEAIKEVQDSGGIAAVIDTEHALNTEYCKQIGVNIDDIYISQPRYGEQAIEAIRALISTGDVDLIVVDSVAAMIPLAELEGESGESKMGLHARLMSQAMKQIAGPASDANCTIIFINQMRSTIAMYGPKKKPTGGNALKFYASQRVEVKNKGQIKEGDTVIGFKQFIKVTKNKVGPPFREVLEDIVYGKGVDEISGLIEALVYEGILEKAGAYYKYKGASLSQGIKKLRIILEDNPDLLEELKEKLKSKNE